MLVTETPNSPIVQGFSGLLIEMSTEHCLKNYNYVLPSANAETILEVRILTLLYAN